MQLFGYREVRIAFLVLALVAVLAPAAAMADIGAADFYTLPLPNMPPCRLYDSRQPAPPAAPAPAGVLPSQGLRTVTVTDFCGVPEDAVAVALNVTVTEATASGDLRLYPTGAPVVDPEEPEEDFAVASLSFKSGVNQGMILVVELGANGDLEARNNSLGALHFIVDVSGYFMAAKAKPDTATVTEDENEPPATIDVLANDLNPNGDTLTITSASDPVNGTVVIAGDGLSLTYEPDPDYCNDPPGTTLDTFTYTIAPSGSTATVSVTVTCVDDDPNAFDDTATVTEDAPATTIDVLANDVDAENDPFTIASASDPANGTVVIAGDNLSLSYQPDADYCGADSFTYTLSPGGDTATVAVTVTCVEGSPVATDDAATVGEDAAATAIDVLLNDTDEEGDPFFIASASDPANGTVVLTGGTPGAHTGLTYQPDANYCGPDSFTYTLTPGGDTATVSVTVTCVDDVPNAADDAATIAEDAAAAAVNVLANDSDPEGDPFFIASASDPANGTVVLTGGTPGAHTGLTYQPDANYCGPDSFTYTLTPGGDTATVSVAVTCVDGAPVAGDDVATVAEDVAATAVNVLLNDTDEEGDPFFIASASDPASGTVVLTGGTPGAHTGLTYQPDANYCGPDSFTYSLTPGGDTASVSVTVTCVNDAPTIDLDANDDKGTGGSDFAVTFTEGEAAKLIEDPVDAIVTDIDTATLASLTVTLTNLLDAGDEILDADLTGFPGITKNYDTTTDPLKGVLVLTGPDTLANFQAVLRKVTYRNTDTDPDTTPRVIEFVANDGSTDGPAATSTVTVAAVDSPPVAVDDAATVAEDASATAIDVLANDTDAENDPILIASASDPANGTVVLTGGTPGAHTGLTYQPDANYCGPDSFTYTLTPGGDTATVSMTVTCVNDNPVAADDAATVLEDAAATPINVLANDTDAENDAFTIASASDPANGAVVLTPAGPGPYTGLTYQPDANYCGPDSFTYTLTPGGDTATVSVTVTCVNDDPVAADDAATVLEDAAATAINVLANDSDQESDAFFIASASDPVNGAVVLTGGTPGAHTGLTYQPDANYCGPDSFTYTLTPGGDSATVVVTMTCVDDPPVAVADAAAVNEDDPATSINVLTNDTDIDAGPKVIASAGTAAHGTVVLTGGSPGAHTGLTYEPADNYCGPDSFIYTLNGGSSTTVSVTVNCVNDPPVADNDAFDFIGNTELVVDLAALSTPHARETTGTTFGVIDGDSDPVENNAITVTAITVGACVDLSLPLDCSDPAVGRVQMESNGRFRFTPAPGDTGATETFQYTLTDNGTPLPASTTATVTLTRFERVWYVKNDAAAGGNGTSASPFNSITAANLSDNDSDGDLTDDLDLANDYIFVYFGNGSSGNQAGGLVLEGGQHLIGQHAGLSLNVSLNGNGAPTNLVAAAVGNRPLLDDNVVDAFEGVSARNVIPAEIVGMNLAGNVNGIDWTTTTAFAGTGTFSIRDNVIRSAGGEGVDINLAGTSGVNLAFHDNNLTSTGTALDIQETGTGTITITAFDDNEVSSNTGGSGIIISNAVFDSVPGGGLNTVDGGTTVIGVSGNGVGGAGMALGNVQGDLHFTGNLNVFADGGGGVTVSGTGAGMQLRVNSGGASTGMIEATGGPAVDASSVALDLRLSILKSTNSASAGVVLSNVTGTFSAESGSSITNATGTDFAITSTSAAVTYGGLITDDVGQLVSVSGSGGSLKSFTGAITDGDDGDGSGISLTGNSSTIRFSGGVVLSTGGNPAFTATGGGTVEVCDENPCNPGATGLAVNKVTTTTGTALNVANTTIGANNLEFRSISAGTAASGPTNGILLNTTGSAGGLKVKGTGSAGSGGTIQRTTGTGVSLTDTAKVGLAYMIVQNSGDDGIFGLRVADFALDNTSVLTNGNSALDEGLEFGNPSGNEVGVSGTVSITNCTFSANAHNNFKLRNGAGNLVSFTVSNSSFNNMAALPNGANSFLFETTNTATVTTATVSGSTFANNGNGAAAGSDYRAFQVTAHGDTGTGNSSTISNFTVSGNTFTNNGLHAAFEVDTAANLQFRMINNLNMTGASPSHAIHVGVSSQTTGGLLQGRIQGNTIGNAGVAGSGSTAGTGINVLVQGRTQAIMLIDGNVIRQTHQAHGINVESRGPTIAGQPLSQSDVTVTNNDVVPGDITGFPAAAIYVVADSQGGSPVRVRADIRSNTVPAGAAVDLHPSYLIFDEVAAAAEAQLVDTAPASATCDAQLDSANTGSATAGAGCALIAGPISTPP
ncbi:MAG TPA: Ig-like domain-containing protein [Thermoanaerobaculia bacterium]|nr:Ig-like domain-containing protein [Thermoanaerobaculia bacterium]